MKITYNELPVAITITMLYEKMVQIEELLVSSKTTNSNEDSILTIKQTSELINLSVPTIYTLVSNSGIPVCKKGKRLYFSKQELMAWIKTGRKKTVSEITSEAKGFLKTKKV